MFKKLFKKGKKKLGFSSGTYWEERYQSGGNSGSGSYGELAKYKANFLNQFVSDNQINLVIDFGCGDGNQLALASYSNYIGLDVSKKAIDLCMRKNSQDKTKSFFLYDPMCFHDCHGVLKSELTLSMEVLFHLIEKDIYEKYLFDLFNASSKFVIIFSSNVDKAHIDENHVEIEHVRHHLFTSDVERLGLPFELIDHKKNPLRELSFSDFYIFKKIESA